jgi:aminoglycoside phosphotransferase (APT) family kinase protein
MLTPREVIPYLCHHNLISARSAVEGDLEVVDASRRNRNFRVVSRRGPGYLLKQGVGPERIATVAHEATIYRRFRSDTRDEGMGRYLPYFYGYDSEYYILILELVRDAENLRDYHVRRRRFSKMLAAATGNALGTLHRLTGVKGDNKQDSDGFSTQPPWILSVHRPDINVFREFSSANIQLIRIIQRFTEFCELLDELRRAWRIETLIHADIKWDNCLTSSHSPSGRKTELRIVDWELAGLGDPCWDVGSVFNDYLSFWLLSIPITGETPPEHFPDLARYPVERMQPAIRSFWHAYIRRMDLDAATANEWLMRAVRYGAARLIQTAIEQMQMSIQLTGNTICILQLSLNIMRRPREAVTHLLGIPLR